MQYTNFLSNDIKRAYCLRGSHDIAICDLETDTFKLAPDFRQHDQTELINTFENKDGEAFYAKGSTIHPSAPVELRRIDGTPLALIECDPKNKPRFLSLLGQQVIGICDKKAVSVFQEKGTLSWAKQPHTGEGAFQKMMDDEIEDGDLPGAKGSPNRRPGA